MKGNIIKRGPGLLPSAGGPRKTNFGPCDQDVALISWPLTRESRPPEGKLQALAGAIL